MTAPASASVSLAIAMMLAANFLFAGVDTTIKWLVGLGVPTVQLAFLRYAGHFVFMLGLFGVSRRRIATPPRAYLTLTVLRSMALVVSTFGNFFALIYLPLTVTSAIMFSAPIIVCMLSGSVLGERVGVWRWSAIFIGFSGVIMVIQPFGGDYHWAALISVGNAFTLAAYSLLTRKLAPLVSTDAMQFTTGAVGTLVLAPFAALVWIGPENIYVLISWLALGFMGWSGHEFLTRAHKRAPANLLMPFSYSFILYMTLVDVVLFKNTPDLWVMIGIGVIVISGLIIWARGQRT